MIDIKNHPLVHLFTNLPPTQQAIVVCPNGETLQFGNNDNPNPIVLYIKNPLLLAQFKKKPLMSLRSSYLHGHWECNHIPEILTLLSQTSPVHTHRLLTKLHHSPAHPSQLNKQSRDQQLLNSLPLDFFSSWLDPSLSHSIASFHPQKSNLLYIAQQRSTQEILNTLAHYHANSVLDTHAMWGSFSEKASIQYDLTLTTLTNNHALFCKSRLQSIPFPINYQITTHTLNPTSYLPFDAAVSILPPLVSQTQWHDYFSYLSRLIRPHGVVVAQLIFDGHFLPTDLHNILQKYGFSISEHRHISDNAYGTFCAWLNNFSSHYQQMQQLGFTDAFLRSWIFYLSEMAFYFRSDALKARWFTFVKH